MSRSPERSEGAEAISNKGKVVARDCHAACFGSSQLRLAMTEEDFHSRIMVRSIYEITSEGGFTKDYSLEDQIRRASVSIMSNIAEGFSRQTDKEFAQFLHVDKGSASEVQSQLYVALDLQYIPEDIFREMYELSEEIMKLISGFIKYLKAS